MDEPIIKIEKCPKCLGIPSKWSNKSISSNHEVYWIGCRQDDLINGGYSPTVATSRWNSLVARVRFEMAHPDPTLKDHLGQRSSYK